MAEKEKKDQESVGQQPAAIAPKKKLVLVLACSFGLLFLIGVPATLFIVFGGDKQNINSSDLGADAAQKLVDSFPLPPDEEEYAEGEEPLGVIMPIDAFVLNLSGGGLLRCQFVVEFVDRDIPKRFYAKSVVIRDALLDLFAAKRADEVASITGRDRLRLEIREKINEILRHQDIKQVYFSQFVVQ